MKEKVCTFFGHRECPDSIRPVLYREIENLIVEDRVHIFYVGNQGQFDAHVRRTLRNLKEKYPYIHYGVVLAYMPDKRQGEDYSDTVFPQGIESVPPRYAIDWRNRWLLRQSDFVIAYITHQWGGAQKFVTAAEKQGKTVISIRPSATL